MEDVRWPAEQLEEHHLEISNRIRNLFWTVSGDYDTEFEPDTEKYVYSKQTVLYEAVKQGAFCLLYTSNTSSGTVTYKNRNFHHWQDSSADMFHTCFVINHNIWIMALQFLNLRCV